MSKKKKNKIKNKKKSYYFKEYVTAKSDGKKKSADKSDSKKKKAIKLSVSKKERAVAKKIIRTPVQVPKEFTKIRQRCNHAYPADEFMSVAQYKATVPAYAAYTPMLDTMLKVYREEELRICPCCYDVMVNGDSIDMDSVETAVAVLYGLSNQMAYHKRAKEVDEVKELAKMRDGLPVWISVAIDEGKRQQKKAERAVSVDTDNGVPADMLQRRLNSQSNATVL